MEVERSGHFNFDEDPIPGFTALSVMLSSVLGLRYVSIVALPLLAPLFVFSLAAILRGISIQNPPSRHNSLTIFSILAIWMLYFGTNPTLFCHTIGLALGFVVILLSVLYIQQTEEGGRETTPKSSIFLLLILSLIAINVISYKLMFFTILFLTVISITVWLENRISIDNLDDYRHGLTPVILIGVILALSFNWVFYESFIPAIRMVDQPMEGLMILLSVFQVGESTPLSQYHFIGESSRIPLYISWGVIVILGLVIVTIVILRKVFRGFELSIGERVIAAFIISSASILVLYNMMGFADMGYLLMGGVLSYFVIVNYCSSRTRGLRNMMLIVILVLLGITVLMNALAIVDDSYGGNTDRNEFYYLKNPVGWYLECWDYNSPIIETDILTGGYLSMEAVSSGKPDYFAPSPFSTTSLLLILESELHQSDENNLTSSDYHCMINYRTNYFVAHGWERFQSWSIHIDKVHANQYMNIIYTSGDIDIATIHY